MTDLLLRGGRPLGQDQADILVRDGVIAGTATEQDGAEVIDLAGQLVLPGLIDSHTHLDKTLFGGPWVPHSAGDPLAERIANERRRRGELGLPNVDHITALLHRMIVSGTTHVRTHTDVYSDIGLKGVEAVEAAAAALAGVEAPEMDRLLDRLTRAHLVRRDGANRYSMHALLKAYAAGPMPVQPRSSRAAQASGVARGHAPRKRWT